MTHSTATTYIREFYQTKWMGHTTVSNFKSYKPKVAVADSIQENSYITKFHMLFREKKAQNKSIFQPMG